MLIALQVLTLLIIYVIPTIKLALLFAVSLYSGILLRIGIKKNTIIISYIASCALIIFLIRIVDVSILFIIFFGIYGLVHESTKHYSILKKQLVRWGCFFISAALLYFAVTYIISIEIVYALWIYALICIATFVAMQILYEICVRELIRITRIKYIDEKIVFKR